MSKQYVRLAPYDKKTGCLARRASVGSCLFKENQWYELDVPWATKLSKLRQGTGAPYFQVKTAEEYRQIVQAELAAAYMRGGVHLAMHGALQPPLPGAPPKRGARKSEFEGMAADEADLSRATGVVTTDTLPGNDEPPEEDEPPAEEAPAEAEAEAEEIDVDSIRTHDAAAELAAKYDVDLSGLRTVAEKRDKLAAELFDDED